MQHPAVHYSGAYTTHHQYQNGISKAPAACDPNLQFFKQTFQQPLQFGLPGYGHPQQPPGAVVGTHSSASTKPWPSDENFDTSSGSSVESVSHPVASPISEMFPIQDFQQLTELENRIVSVQQYESLLSQLQAISFRCNGLMNEMWRSFISDSVLGRIGFARTKNGKYSCAMRSDLQRIMMAIKASWFPTLDQGAFEIQMAHLLKNAHSRCKTKVNDSGESPPVNSPASSKDLEASLNVECPSVTAYQPNVPASQPPPVLSAPPQPEVHMFLQNQWYRYAVYYRDRYQVARKANQKMKADYVEQEKDYRKRISACLKRVRSMQRCMDALEKRLQ